MDIVTRLRGSIKQARALDRSALLAEAAAEIERLHLTEAEREALEYAVVRGHVASAEDTATLRVLLERTSPQPYEKPDEKQGVCDTGSLPPEWLARPYWVDPPSGWRYGFPRLYDPAADGDMTEWMIAQGYPEQLARQGLACTFTAADDH